MTETSTAPDIPSLEALLLNVGADPVEQAETIRQQREALAEDPAALWDLDALELCFLEKQAARRRADPSLGAEVRAARQAAMDSSLRSLRVTTAESPAVLFDLAELRAAYLNDGNLTEAEEVAALIQERLPLMALDQMLEEEARERYAAILTDEEELSLRERIGLLKETAAIMQALLERSGQKVYAKMARRLTRAAGDRGLALRLESLLGRRGAVALETTSMLLLIVVFVLLAVEAVVEVKEGVREMFILVDGFICLFFIAEFAFKVCLAPARRSWFLRNVLIDFLPAIPAALLLLPTPPPVGGQQLVYVRAGRLIRIFWFARYIRFLRPVLGLFRLLLFLIRGMDSLAQRFSSLLNRNFVFFEEGVVRASGDDPSDPSDPSDRRDPRDPRPVLFQAIRREHVLLDNLKEERILESLRSRAQAVAARLETQERRPHSLRSTSTDVRDVPVEAAVERLYSLRPDELNLTMSRTDIMALDRVGRVLNAPVIRAVPFVRWFVSQKPGDTPEQRVVSLGRRVADRLELWRGRILFFADLHGIVTGPQILDRVASAMVRASQRPAVRLLLFGGLFWIARMMLGEESGLGLFLKKFVATPLVVLGGFCFFVLLLGRWLKRLAGEAAESLKRTSEAHFINLLELVKARTRDADLSFLARRIFRWELDPFEASMALGRVVQEATTGRAEQGGQEPPAAVREDLSRVAFLYLHFLDGAILHESDIKTTEQLLANLSLENIRHHHLRFTRKDEKRLRKLSLASGSIFTGPFLWFRFITESVALESAKRITEYNRHCLSLQQRRVATKPEVEDMDRWLAERRQEMEGRILEKLEAPDSGATYHTTEFNALDFLSVNEDRDRQIERIFGTEVLEVLRRDRKNMIRDIFGTRPLHRLPRSQRSVNFYRFYQNRLSGGRLVLVPFLFVGAIWKMGKLVLAKTTSIVKEILNPETAGENQASGHASFRVALRKIHRMKAPGLLEAMQMRVAFDPAYCGAPPTWSFGMTAESHPELERDMDFLQMREREREVMREIAAENRRQVERLHLLVQGHDEGGEEEAGGAQQDDEMERRLGERAVTIAFITDRMQLRSLFAAQEWFERVIPRMEDARTFVRGSLMRSFLAACRRGFRRHPVTQLLKGRLVHRKVSWRGRRNLRKAYLTEFGDTRPIVDAWLELPEGVQPRDRALALAKQFFQANGEVSRELVALRAVQTLSVLDVRNYRDIVFRLGRFEEDGENPELAQALP